MHKNLNLIFHHVGIAVNSIEEAVQSYVPVFGADSISSTYQISSQSVNVCFIKTGDNSYIELVEGCEENSTINRMLKKGISYYHVGYLSSSIEKDVLKLTELNFKCLDYFNSEAFEGRRCIFLISPEGHLIELIEK